MLQTPTIASGFGLWLLSFRPTRPVALFFRLIRMIVGQGNTRKARTRGTLRLIMTHGGKFHLGASRTDETLGRQCPTTGRTPLRYSSIASPLRTREQDTTYHDLTPVRTKEWRARWRQVALDPTLRKL